MISFFLLSDIFSHIPFITAYCAYPISCRPKMQSRHSSFLQQLPVYSYCTLPFQESYRVCNAIFWRDAQTQMHMVIHRMTFQQPYALLLTQVLQNLAYCCSEFPKYYLLPIFRYKYYVILALPSYMRQTFKAFHLLFLLPIRAFPWGKSLPHSRLAGTAEPVRVARPEAVGLAGTNLTENGSRFLMINM